MRRALLVMIAVSACASAGTTTEDSTPRQATIFSDPNTPTILAERPRAVAITIARPPAAVWLAAKKVYTDFEIPLTVENPTTHQMGNADFYKSRQVAGQPMVQFVDCGTGMTGPKATSYRIYMSLLSSITGDGHGGTSVQTTFTAMGQDMTGGSSDRIVCGSTGRFEALFLEKVKLAAGG